MKSIKAVFCACALLAFCALTVHNVTSATVLADPPQDAVDYSKGYPEKAAGASHMSLPNPMLLGDPKTSDQWGLDDTWGISKFTHQEHTEKYKLSCKTCHHTNGAENAALKEDVERCVKCHKAEGDENNPYSEDGAELWVKEAFHVGVAGCIECHKAEQAKNPNSTAAVSCSGCHEKKG